MIIQFILDLVTRAFSPRLRDVKDVADNLLRKRDAPPVGDH